MRNLTSYELTVLIQKEIEMMQRNVIEKGTNINYIRERAKDILKYIQEYDQIEEL